MHEKSVPPQKGRYACCSDHDLIVVLHFPIGDLPIQGVNVAFIFLAASVKFEFVDHAAVFTIKLSFGEGGLTSGETGAVQSFFFSLADADVLTVVLTAGRRMVLSLIINAADLAGQGVNAVIIFLTVRRIKFDLILPDAVIFVQLGLNEGDLVGF